MHWCHSSLHALKLWMSSNLRFKIRLSGSLKKNAKINQHGLEQACQWWNAVSQ